MGRVHNRQRTPKEEADDERLAMFVNNQQESSTLNGTISFTEEEKRALQHLDVCLAEGKPFDFTWKEDVNEVKYAIAHCRALDNFVFHSLYHLLIKKT